MKSIDPQELQERLERGEDWLLLDVREEAEWAVGHLPGAVLRPLSRIADWQGEFLQPDRPVVIYCHHGVRSARVCSWLRRLGGEGYWNLRGGVAAWKERVDPDFPAD